MYRLLIIITGLDPAKPLIDMFTMDEFRLTRDDADFVEVIHTNSGVYGEFPQIGHADFSINGGQLQPSCSSQSNIIRKIEFHSLIFWDKISIIIYGRVGLGSTRRSEAPRRVQSLTAIQEVSNQKTILSRFWFQHIYAGRRI